MGRSWIGSYSWIKEQEEEMEQGGVEVEYCEECIDRGHCNFEERDDDDQSRLCEDGCGRLFCPCVPFTACRCGKRSCCAECAVSGRSLVGACPVCKAVFTCEDCYGNGEDQMRSCCGCHADWAFTCPGCVPAAALLTCTECENYLRCAKCSDRRAPAPLFLTCDTTARAPGGTHARMCENCCSFEELETRTCGCPDDSPATTTAAVMFTHGHTLRSLVSGLDNETYERASTIHALMNRVTALLAGRLGRPPTPVKKKEPEWAWLGGKKKKGRKAK
jgi:hypothetical protein